MNNKTELLAFALIMGSVTSACAQQSQLVDYYVGAMFGDNIGNRITPFGTTGKSTIPNNLLGGGVIGINLSDGALFLGFDARGNFAANHFDQHTRFAEANLTTFPRTFEFGSCSGCTLPSPSTFTQNQSSGSPLSIDTRIRYHFADEEGGDLSFRMGYRLGRYVFFGRVGGGVASFRAANTNDDTRSKYCTITSVTTVYTQVAVGEVNDVSTANSCVATENGTSQRTSAHTTVPDVLMGIGVEYHFVPEFVRMEVELHHAFSSAEPLWEGSQEGITSVRTMMTVGVDF